ncbi:MAG: metal ABC transporter solute-binding protein, Zn/Mn family, partial [Planctomycetia bacterium]
KASPGDVAALSAADVVVYNGLHLEGKMADLFHRLAKKKKTLALGEALDTARLLKTPGGTDDPHVWFDTALWAETLKPTADLLAEVDPPHAADYHANAARYKDELLKLDAEVRALLATIPKDRRVLVTAHDAFHYFGRAYDVEVRGVQGVSTDAEAGVAEVNDLVVFLVDRKIGAVFVESSVSDRNVQALLEGCAARGHTVKVGGELHSDALGPPDGTAGDYPGMVRGNARVIADALR